MKPPKYNSTTPHLNFSFRAGLLKVRLGVSREKLKFLTQWCQDFFGRGPHFGSQKPGGPQHRILVNAWWQLLTGGGGCKSKIFPRSHARVASAAHGPQRKCGPRTAAGRTSQFRGPHYNAHFWTLGGPQFMTSRATFGSRAALFTPLL